MPDVDSDFRCIVVWRTGHSRRSPLDCLVAPPVPVSGGYLFRFAYIGIGGDVRGIDQDNRLRLKYVNADVLPGRTLEGNVNTTHISDSDARTTVRLNIALGGAPVQ